MNSIIFLKNYLYLYGYWGLSNVDPRRYKVSSSLLVVLFFKSSFSSRASVGRRGTCDCTPTLKLAMVLKCEFSDSMENVPFPRHVGQSVGLWVLAWWFPENQGSGLENVFLLRQWLL